MRSTASYIRIIGFAILGYLFLNWVGSTGETSIFIEQPWLWALYGFLILFHIAVEVSVAGLEGVLYRTLKPAEKATYDERVERAKANQFKWIKDKYKASLGSKAMEEEHEIILDHDYDGIRELDNDLPPWWKYIFYATFIFAVIYLVRFEVLQDYNQDEEYEAAVAEAKIQIEEWKKTAKNLVDVNTVTLLTDASDIAAGKNIFTTNCVACHKADGGGGIGPNLTDEFWILGGGIKNVFSTISEGGRDGKGMVSWKNDLKPLEMAQVASYLLSFQGTTPADPKAAEGEPWVDPKATEANDISDETLQEISETIVDTTVVKTLINN
jgi:cytochrome c oxidase cbb3-type subunit 3